MKAIFQDDYVLEVKEELIEINPETVQLVCYAAVIERHKYSLHELATYENKNGVEKFGVWLDKPKSIDEKEVFSIQKYRFYFYQCLKALNYIHSNCMYYGDLRPHNVLIMKNQKVKFGDFHLSLYFTSFDDEFKLRGITPNWCLPEMHIKYSQAK